MHIYIVCDVEGAFGVGSYENDAFPEAPNYPEARRNLVEDLRAAIRGAKAAGATAFTIYDMHYYGDNVRPGELGDEVTLARGKPLDNGMRRGFAGMFMVGLHAMAGNPGGVLPHTYNHEIVSMDVNGRRVGEIGLEALAAGCHGIPLIFLSADAEGVSEARALLGDVEGVAVKCLGASGEVVFVPEKAARSGISEGARRAVGRIGDFGPLVETGPCRLEILYSDAGMAAKVAARVEGQLSGKSRVVIEGDDFWPVYMRFRRTQARS